MACSVTIVTILILWLRHLTFCIFKQNPGLVDQYISTLLSLDQSPTTLVLLGMCLDFCTAQKDKATIEKHKVDLL